MNGRQTQRKKFRMYRKRGIKAMLRTLVVILCIAAVAVGLKIAYDKHLYGEFEVAAPTAGQMANIAENWEILESHTDKFYNYYDRYYSMFGYENDGTDGNGNVVLIYTGHEDIEEIFVQIATAAEVTDVTAYGHFARTTLRDFIKGVAPWNEVDKQVVATNGKCDVVIYDVATEALDGAILAEVIAELEAIIAEGPVPVAVEETQADEVAWQVVVE